MKFKAKRVGNWFKIDNVESVQRYLEQFSPDEILDIDIDKVKVKRNLSQNALIHALFMEIDKLTDNYDPAKTKWQTLIEVGFYQEFEINGRLEKLPLSTSKLDKSEFAELCDRIIKWTWNRYQVDITPPSQRGY